MAFTYDPALADDVSLVRFHIGDTDELEHYLEDATIQHFITAGSVGTAVIACIKYIITRLSQPDESTGQHSLNYASALAGYQALLKQKALELSVTITPAITASTVSNPYRGDSYMTTGTQDGKP